MSLKQLFEIYKTFENKEVIFSFQGQVSEQLLVSVLDVMEKNFSEMEGETKLKKKVINVLVECIQNLYHHKEIIDNESTQVLLLVVKKEDGFYIQTGNYIDKHKGIELKDRLLKVNSFSKDELKEYYQKTLNEGFISEKGTAGLGLIDIARKSGNKLEYEIFEGKDNVDFFSLNIKVD